MNIFLKYIKQINFIPDNKLYGVDINFSLHDKFIDI
jgi:hypothetical protein